MKIFCCYSIPSLEDPSADRRVLASFWSSSLWDTSSRYSAWRCGRFPRRFCTSKSRSLSFWFLLWVFCSTRTSHLLSTDSIWSHTSVRGVLCWGCVLLSVWNTSLWRFRNQPGSFWFRDVRCSKFTASGSTSSTWKITRGSWSASWCGRNCWWSHG